jgi:hypothetical protein
MDTTLNVIHSFFGRIGKTLYYVFMLYNNECPRLLINCGWRLNGGFY